MKLIIIIFLIVFPSFALANAKEKLDFSIKPSSVGSYMVAVYTSSINDYEEAANYYMNVIAKNPENPVVIEKTYKLLLLAGRVEESFYYAKKFLEFQNNSLSANILVILDLVERSEFKEAEKKIQNLKNSNRFQLNGVDSIILPFLKAWVYVGANKDKMATKELKAILKKNPEASFVSLQLAIIYDYLGKIKQAEKLYEQVVQEDYLHERVVRLVVNFYMRNKKNVKAKELIAKYREENQNEKFFKKELNDIKQNKVPKVLISSPIEGMVEVLMESVRILYKSGFYAESLAYLSMVEYFDENLDEAKVLHGKYYMEEDLYKRALDKLYRVNKKSDFYPQARNYIAKSWFMLGNKKKARLIFSKTAKEYPDEYASYLILADLLRDDKKYMEAAAIYSKALHRIKNLTSQYWSVFFARGIAYEKSGRWELAEKDFLKALELNPNQSEVLNYLGYSWIDKNIKVKEAKKMIDKALSMRPDDPHIVDSMGWAYFKMGNYKKAVRYLEGAIESLPYDPIINDHLGDVYWKLGRKMEAVYQWKRSIENNKNDLVDADLIKEKIENGIK